NYEIKNTNTREWHGVMEGNYRTQVPVLSRVNRVIFGHRFLTTLAECGGLARPVFNDRGDFLIIRIHV
ncbi:MAG TPA: hypothetical protein VGK00_12790, partial [Anaerolineales bacterium]